jgi:hypothetical protein
MNQVLPLKLIPLKNYVSWTVRSVVPIIQTIDKQHFTNKNQEEQINTYENNIHQLDENNVEEVKQKNYKSIQEELLHYY